MNRIRQHRHTAQRGVVLFVTLILLLVLSLLAVTLTRTQSVEERLAQNDSNHQVAFQAAEAALRAAMAAMQAGTYVSGGTTVVLSDAAFAANTAGLYTLSAEPTMSTASPQSIASTNPWGDNTKVLSYNGPALTSLPANAQNPTFLIEKLPTTCVPSCSCTSPSTLRTYRIVAHGVGADATSAVTLQQIYYRC